MTERSLEEIEELEAENRRKDEEKRRADAERRRRYREAYSLFEGKSSEATQGIPVRANPGLPPSRMPPGSALGKSAPKDTGTAKASPSQIPATEQKSDTVAKAKDDLQTSFPRIQIDDKRLGDEDKTFLDKRLGTTPGLVTALLENFLPPQGAQRDDIEIVLFSEGTTASGESKGIRVKVQTKNPLSAQDERKRPFTLNQVYENEKGELALHIETVVAPGKGKNFFKSSVLPQAKQLDIRKITLDAFSIGGTGEGTLAWARYGFVPTREAWDRMRATGLSILSSNKKELKPIRSQLKQALNDPSPKALRWLVFLSWKERKEKTEQEGGKGKKGASGGFLSRILSMGRGQEKEPLTATGLLNTILGSKWEGELDLTDPKSKAWVETYVDTAKAEDQLEAFEGLLEKLAEP